MDYRLPIDLKDKLQAKRLIFTVTTGRSGTNYVTNMLSYLPHVTSLHEPDPAYHTILRDVQTNPALAYEFLIEQKLPEIAKHDTPTYIETSHLFCKGFFEPLLDLGITPDLILLTRKKRDVARSMYQLGHIPARSDIGRAFLVQPDDPNVLPLPNWDNLHDYQLCYWYTLEIERRQLLYAAEVKNRGGNTYIVLLEEFTTISGYWKTLFQMNLPKPRPINALKHLRSHIRRVNNKDDIKDPSREANYDVLEAEVHRLMNEQ